jgi:hypothetical protein
MKDQYSMRNAGKGDKDYIKNGQTACSRVNGKRGNNGRNGCGLHRPGMNLAGCTAKRITSTRFPADPFAVTADS